MPTPRQPNAPADYPTQQGYRGPFEDDGAEIHLAVQAALTVLLEMVNDQRTIRVPLATHGTGQTGANLDETTLTAHLLTADFMATDGDRLVFEGHGTFAANDNEKTIRVNVKNSAMATLVTTANGKDFMWRALFIRAGSSSQRWNVVIMVDGESPQVTVGTSSEDHSDVMSLNLTGQNGTASAGDIITYASHVHALMAAGGAFSHDDFWGAAEVYRQTLAAV